MWRSVKPLVLEKEPWHHEEDYLLGANSERTPSLLMAASSGTLLPEARAMITIDFLSKLRSEVDELLKESDSKRFSILSKSQAGILLGLGGLSKERDQLISLNNPEERSNLNLILMVRLGATCNQ